jgi:hypothetical protein
MNMAWPCVSQESVCSIINNKRMNESVRLTPQDVVQVERRQDVSAARHGRLQHPPEKDDLIIPKE